MKEFKALDLLGMSRTFKRTGDRKTTKTAILRDPITCKNVPWFYPSSSRNSFLKNTINKINKQNRSPVAHWISSNGSSQNTGQWKKIISSHDMHSYLFEAAHSAAKSKRKAVMQRACWPTQIESQSRKTPATIAMIHQGRFLWIPLVSDNTQVQTRTSTQTIAICSGWQGSGCLFGCWNVMGWTSLATDTEKHLPDLSIKSVFCKELNHNAWAAFTVVPLCKKKKEESNFSWRSYWATQIWKWMLVQMFHRKWSQGTGMWRGLDNDRQKENASLLSPSLALSSSASGSDPRWRRVQSPGQASICSASEGPSKVWPLHIQTKICNHIFNHHLN